MMPDQADQLRTIVQNKKSDEEEVSGTAKGPEESLIPGEHSASVGVEVSGKMPLVYSILSGKGGVGKTSIAVNLGISLSQLGKKVLILDADIGMSNSNILLGVYVKNDIFDALDDDEIDFRKIIVKTDYGVDLISGGADFFKLEGLTKEKQDRVVEELSVLEEYDVMIVDNGAGISRQSIAFTIVGDEIILVTTPEPTAITDAYRVLKIISLYKLKKNVKVIVNQCRSKESGQKAFEKLSNTASRFLKIELEFLGEIFDDVRVNKAVMEEIPLVINYPSSLAGKGIQWVGYKLLNEQERKGKPAVFSKLGNKILRIFG
jgi:flagellar biosynthesis protein FlhG